MYQALMPRACSKHWYLQRLCLFAQHGAQRCCVGDDAADDAAAAADDDDDDEENSYDLFKNGNSLVQLCPIYNSFRRARAVES